MSGVPTTQQRRARHAWETVQAVPGEQWDEFDGHTKQLGPRIVTAGLGPAIAFTAAKDGGLLVGKLSDWVLHKGKAPATAAPAVPGRAPPRNNVAPSPPADLQQRIRDSSSDELRQWTKEALEWIVWVKRFCAADKRSQGTEMAGGGR